MPTTFDTNLFQSTSEQDLIQLIQEMVAQQGGYTRQQALADTAGLTEAAMRDLSSGQLAELNRSLEGAGASGSALSALLATEMTAATAGQVAKQQGAQVLGAEQQQKDRRDTDLNALIALLGNLTGSTGKKLDFMSSFNRGGFSGPSGIGTAPSSSSEFTINRNRQPTQTVFRGAKQGKDVGSVPVI